MPGFMRRSVEGEADGSLRRYAQYRNASLISRIESLATDDRTRSLLGCMLGLAVGDILGCPVEGMSYASIQRTYGAIQHLVEPQDGRHWRLPGLHSDDTQQALVVLQAYADMRRVHLRGTPERLAEDLARRTAELYVDGASQPGGADLGCWRGTGGNFRAVVEDLARNRRSRSYPFTSAQPSAGLGAAMRVPAIGLLADSTQEAFEWLRAVTLVTHSDLLGLTSAWTAASAARLLAESRGRSLDPRRFLDDLRREVAGAEAALVTGPVLPSSAPANTMSQLIAHVADLLLGDPAAAMRSLQRALGQLVGHESHPTSGYGPSGIAACLYFLCASIENPERALLTTINAGGDTDTTGAIVGAWTGALYGPGTFRRFLPDVLALDLIYGKVVEALQPDGERGQDLLAAEAALTVIEARARAERTGERVGRDQGWGQGR